MKQRPFFITFEGGEGTGKSTQIRLLSDYLTRCGLSVTTTREPGGSTGAEEIRHILLKGDTNRWDKITEILLFSAARRDHLEKTIQPALKRGDIVISDRFADSTKAYQGYGYGTDTSVIEALNQTYTLIAGDFKPNVTFILDIDPAIGLKRSCERAGNTEQRFESMDMTFHQNLRQGFLTIAADNPDRCVVINANQSIDAVHSDIIDVLKRKLV